MKNHEIEAWSLSIIDRCMGGLPIEDDRVELKSLWIEASKAARQIAGHANASRGGQLLWLIGVDEGNRAVPGVEHEEMSSWLSEVRSHFDGLMPSVTSLNIPWSDVVVVALLFETDRAPFVIVNPHFGTRRDDPISFEVPWREGTETRTASRTDLLRILAPVARLPQMEVLWARAEGDIYTPPQSENDAGDAPDPRVRVTINMKIYAVPADDSPVVIPDHKVAMLLSWPGIDSPIRAGNAVVIVDSRASSMVSGLTDELLIGGPGSFRVTGKFEFGVQPAPSSMPVTADCLLEPVLASSVVVVEATMNPTDQRHVNHGPSFESWGDWYLDRRELLTPGDLGRPPHG